MHFCSVCQNMYYTSVDPNDANKLIYYCRNCGNTDNNISTNNVSVFKMQLKNTESTVSNDINPYTKFDPTLPRVNKILCPNAECATNKGDENREIIYIRYNTRDMKYAYMCATCDTVWNIQDKK